MTIYRHAADSVVIYHVLLIPMHPVSRISTCTKRWNLVFAVHKRMKNMASFPVRGGIRAALFSVAGLTFRLPPYDTPCSVPVNGPKFSVYRLYKLYIILYIYSSSVCIILLLSLICSLYCKLYLCNYTCTLNHCH